MNETEIFAKAMGVTELLLNSELAPEQRECQTIVQRSADSLVGGASLNVSLSSPKLTNSEFKTEPESRFNVSSTEISKQVIRPKY
jgi:hypothetical protein